MPAASRDDFPPTLIDRIREQARAKGRTLQQELGDLLAFADKTDAPEPEESLDDCVNNRPSKHTNDH